jgi:eukaryotic-like serine/threonine-protein kinase
VPKVSDFGLARHLDEPGQTRTGQVVGTPAYMAPELVEGQRAGPEADVWALGAILYQCLTGRPPFVADTPAAVFRLIAGSEPAAPRGLRPDVPRDLENICLKCLNKEPHRRYPTAAELADDLGRFLRREPVSARPRSTGGRLALWARRRPALALLAATTSVAVVALLAVWGTLTASLRHERNELAKERDLANARLLQARTNLGHAHDAVQELLTGVGDSAELRKLPVDPLRRRLLAAARDYYQKLADASGDDPEMLYRLAKSHHLLAYYTRQMGLSDDILPDQLRSAEILEAVCQQAPGELRYRAELAVALVSLGSNLRGDHGRGEALIRRGIEAWGEVIAAEPDVGRHRWQLGTACLALANLQRRQGNASEAEASYLRAIGHLERAVAMPVALSGYRKSLSDALCLLARLDISARRFDRAEKLVGQAVALMALHAKHNKELADRVPLARSLGVQAELEEARGRNEAALRARAEARSLWAGLSRDSPSNATYLGEVARACQAIGRLERSLGQASRAEAAWKEEAELRGRLAKGQPKSAAHAADFADACLRLAGVSGDEAARRGWSARAAAALKPWSGKLDQHARLAELWRAAQPPP